MAKLTANGRTELVRLAKTAPGSDSSSGAIETVRTEIAVMSDRKLLQKTTWFKDGKLDFTTGWKLRSKMREGVEISAICSRYQQLGYEVVR
jgi:hypothetical protein